jgi:hypothetical protein
MTNQGTHKIKKIKPKRVEPLSMVVIVVLFSSFRGFLAKLHIFSLELLDLLFRQLGLFHSSER